MIIGGYTLDLYCDNVGCPHRYDKTWNPYECVAEFGSTCRKMARKAGWKLDHDHTLCPDCAKDGGGT